MADTVLRNSGSTTADVYIVSADQDTIVGDGTSRNPLRAGPGGGGGTFAAAFRDGIDPAPGMPVAASPVLQAGGITTVQQTDVTAVAPSSADFGAAATACGVVTLVNEDGTVQVQSSGLVTLSTSQWDAMTGDSGGLVRGRTYYAARSDSVDDFLSGSPPPEPGAFRTRVGVAFDEQTMLLTLAAPVQNLGDLIVFATFAGSPLILGSAVIVSTADHVAAAVSDVSVTAGQAIGVVAALDGDGEPIVQLGGIVTLTTAEWDAVTNTSPGMVAGDAYFVDTSASPGHLTAGAPTTGAKVQVGVGLSTTQMVIAPYLQRLS